MIDTRREVLRVWGQLEISSTTTVIKVTVTTIVAALVALVPDWVGLSPAGAWSLFILLLGAGLWITEALPSFSVALLIIALQIVILGRPGGVFAKTATDWEMFVRPWASPLMWLFFGGFVLAEAAQATGLDRLFSRYVLGWFGTKPGAVLFGAMAVTFTFSMFMSNTATAAMMMAVIMPIVNALEKDDPFIKAILLGIPFAANIGGMGTIIGSPPNAIAAGSLAGTVGMDFIQWIFAGLPPAIVLFVIVWAYLRFAYPAKKQHVDLSGLQWQTRTGAQLPMWKRLLVMPVFIITVLLWMTEPLHHIPTPVVSFIPITILAVTGVMTAKNIRNLHWDVLLLLAGGLSLGVAVRQTGLAAWLVSLLPIEVLGPLMVAVLLAYVATTMSNFMSNTAAANILVPIGMAIGLGMEALVVVPIALGASAAMCLPISTPPNAIAFATGRLQTSDFIRGGLLIGLLAPAIATVWCYFVLA
ncbi:MAG: DASS family sodium-coupled anion symporter [Candidatus Neomarinimicrobiota bacterium]